MPDLLLASSSRSHPGGHLAHLGEAIREWADGLDEILFVPWAQVDHDGYTAATLDVLGPLGLQVTGLHEHADPRGAIASAAAVFVGGGNTFLLLDRLQASGVLPLLRQRVASGATRYLGTSAGSNLACPTIQTTNDMPVVWPRGGPAGLAVVAWQLNVHYVDPDPASTHQGETRLQRLAEYHEHHSTPVLGLREHGWLRVRGDQATIDGAPGVAAAPGVLVRPDIGPADLLAGTRLDGIVPVTADGDG